MFRHPVLASVWDSIVANSRSPVTLRTYKSRLARVASSPLLPLPADRCVSDLLDTLNPTASVNTRSVYINFLLMCSKMSTEFADLIGGGRALDDLRVYCEQSRREREAYQRLARPHDVQWSDLVALAPKVEYFPIRERILYALYIYPGIGGDVQIVPRNDFVDCKVVKAESECEDTTINYCVLPSDPSSHPFIRLNQYKSARFYGAIDLHLPDSTAHLIRRQGTPYVFSTRADPSLPTTDSALQRQIQRLFGKLGIKCEGRNRCGVTTLRRAYAKHTGVTMADDEEARMRCAHKCGHMLSTHVLYGTQEQPQPVAAA